MNASPKTAPKLRKPVKRCLLRLGKQLELSNCFFQGRVWKDQHAKKFYSWYWSTSRSIKDLATSDISIT